MTDENLYVHGVLGSDRFSTSMVKYARGRGAWPASGRVVAGGVAVRERRRQDGMWRNSPIYVSGLAERAIWLWVARNSASIADCAPSNRQG